MSQHDHHAEHHHHGHQHDRGALGLLRYLRLLPQMWRSDVSDEVVRMIGPKVGERVVDLGAGMGPATMGAARTGAAVIAVDPTPYMRWIMGLRRSWQRGRAAITVREGAAESIPVEKGSIDGLWTVNTVHHWIDQTAASRELARVMRPGGRVLLVDEDFDDPAHPAHEEMQARRAGRDAHHFHEIDVDVLAAALVAAGFATATGSRTTIAARPAKVVRATR
jgi:SAM-dependent methyltransferase